MLFVQVATENSFISFLFYMVKLLSLQFIFYYCYLSTVVIVFHLL